MARAPRRGCDLPRAFERPAGLRSQIRALHHRRRHPPHPRTRRAAEGPARARRVAPLAHAAIDLQRAHHRPRSAHRRGELRHLPLPRRRRRPPVRGALSLRADLADEDQATRGHPRPHGARRRELHPMTMKQFIAFAYIFTLVYGAVCFFIGKALVLFTVLALMGAPVLLYAFLDFLATPALACVMGYYA